MLLMISLMINFGYAKEQYTDLKDPKSIIDNDLARRKNYKPNLELQPNQRYEPIQPLQPVGR